MTPKQKAQELYSNYEHLNCMYNVYKNTESIISHAKQCALIAVDELINVIKDLDNWAYTYFIEVKQEIEAL
jgi:hypothetical protein